MKRDGEVNRGIFFSHGTTQAGGVAILLKKQASMDFIDTRVDNTGQWITLKVKIYNETYLLVNVYGSNMDEVSFFGLLMQNIEEMDSDHIIMGGGFNLVLDITIDKQRGSPSTHSEAANF